MNRKSEIKTDIRNTQKELEDASDLDVLASSRGGQKLINGFLTDIIANLETLSVKGKEMTHVELISIALDLKHKFDVVKALRNARNNKLFLRDELKNLMKKAEELPEEDEG